MSVSLEKNNKPVSLEKAQTSDEIRFELFYLFSLHETENMNSDAAPDIEALVFSHTAFALATGRRPLVLKPAFRYLIPAFIERYRLSEETRIFIKSVLCR